MQWIKASERLPEDNRPLDKSPGQVIVKWMYLGEYQRIDLMTPNQLHDRVKAENDPDYYEWLDEGCRQTTPEKFIRDYYEYDEKEIEPQVSLVHLSFSDLVQFINDWENKK